MKKFLKIMVWILTVGAIVTGWVFTHKGHIEHPLKGVQLTLDREKADGFIDYHAVYQNIMDICDTVNNTDITMIPVDSVRKYLQTIPWATCTDANLSLDEALVANVVECQPVVRVYNKHGKSVYLDADGNIYPVSSRYVPHLLVGSGFADFPVVTGTSACIHDGEYANTDLPGFFSVMMSVLNNSYSRCCVKQVFYTKDKIYELTMNNVSPKVILGDGEDTDLKLRNLQCFFEQMQGNPDLENYSKVDFNYVNQVVCTKKIK